jgi:hypothetical protein
MPVLSLFGPCLVPVWSLFESNKNRIRQVASVVKISRKSERPHLGGAVDY